MSNYCKECRYRPDLKTGEYACPITVLYCDYLARNEEELAGNQRMGLQLRNLKRMGSEERSGISEQAKKTRQWILEESNNASKPKIERHDLALLIWKACLDLEKKDDKKVTAGELWNYLISSRSEYDPEGMII